MRELKEELTTLMHSEFTVSNDTDKKIRCWTALKSLNGNLENPGAGKECKSYGVTLEEAKSHLPEWLELTGRNK